MSWKPIIHTTNFWSQFSCGQKEAVAKHNRPWPEKLVREYNADTLMRTMNADYRMDCNSEGRCDGG